jgi:hypothetical protein
MNAFSFLDRYQSHAQIQAQLAAFFADPGEEELAVLKVWKDYQRKHLAERPKPKPKPRKKKAKPIRYIRFSQMPECEYTRERRIFAPPTKRLSRDAQHRSWDGYVWSIV